MTADVAEAEARGGEDGRPAYGEVIIEWPAPRPGRVLPSWGCSIFDAVTGKPITTASKITIPAVTADVQDIITCELVMFADADGQPILGPGEDGKFTMFKDADDKIKTGVFPFLVAEMRVRS